MAYASQSGRARTSSANPEAFGVCDRCGIWYQRRALSFQYDWAGASLINKRLLVCPPCYDVPQQQLRAIVVPADPVPIVQPRTEPFVSDETNYRSLSGQDTTDPTTGLPIPGTTVRITQSNDPRVPQQTGEPSGGLNTLPGTDPNIPLPSTEGVLTDGLGNAILDGFGNPIGTNIVYTSGLPYENTTIPSTGTLNYVITYLRDGNGVVIVDGEGTPIVTGVEII